MPTPKKSPVPLPVWLLLSFAEWCGLLNILCPTPPLAPDFRLRWWRWRRHKRLRAVWSRYRFEPQLRDFLFRQLRL